MAGTVTLDAALTRLGTGAFQRRLLGIFGLVWAADAMQVLAIGFTGPSIAQSFGLPVGQAIQESGSLFFLGMLIGAWGFGQLADRFGRRRVLIVTVLMDAVFGLLSAVAPNYELLLLLRFLTGLAVGGTLPVDYALMAEFLPPARRGRWLVALEGFWAIGTVVIVAAAWVAAQGFDGKGIDMEAWRFLFLVTGVPALIGVLLRLWVPESPYHLARGGRSAELKAVFARIARGNGKPALAEELVAEPRPRGSFLQLFAGELRWRSLMILLVWFLVSAAYYGVFVWLPNWLARADESFGFVRGYGFLLLVALAQVPGYALAALGVERIGRRPTLIVFLVASAAGCLLFVLAATPSLIAVALLLMSFALLGTWGALYAFTPELYPTALRATGMGSAGAMARLGGLLAPLAVASIATASFEAAIGLFAALLLLGALAAAAIPVETRNVALR